jgi:hypothetical protein
MWENSGLSLKGKASRWEYDPTIAPAQGVSTGGRIRLMPDMPPAEEFSVLAHELAHEMMHHDKAAAPVSKVVRETQAEAVAFHEKTTSCQQKNTLQCWTSRFPAPPKVRDTLPLRIQSGL